MQINATFCTVSSRQTNNPVHLQKFMISRNPQYGLYVRTKSEIDSLNNKNPHIYTHLYF